MDDAMASALFALRVVNCDFYMGFSLQKDSSVARGGARANASNSSKALHPIIRIFGSTPAGQKCCAHIHGVFPYFYVHVPNPLAMLAPSLRDKYLRMLECELEDALFKLSSAKKGGDARYSKAIKALTVVRGIPFFGYHHAGTAGDASIGAPDRGAGHVFIRVVMFSPYLITTASKLLEQGLPTAGSFQPYESHIPYLLQFFMDYNITGMSFLCAQDLRFRLPLPSSTDLTPLTGVCVPLRTRLHVTAPAAAVSMDGLGVNTEDGGYRALHLRVWLSSNSNPRLCHAFPTVISDAIGGADGETSADTTAAVASTTAAASFTLNQRSLPAAAVAAPASLSFASLIDVPNYPLLVQSRHAGSVYGPIALPPAGPPPAAAISTSSVSGGAPGTSPSAPLEPPPWLSLRRNGILRPKDKHGVQWGLLRNGAAVISKESTCAVECDIWASDILNPMERDAIREKAAAAARATRLARAAGLPPPHIPADVAFSTVLPLSALWNEETQRRRALATAARLAAAAAATPTIAGGDHSKVAVDTMTQRYLKSGADDANSAASSPIGSHANLSMTQITEASSSNSPLKGLRLQQQRRALALGPHTNRSSAGVSAGGPTAASSGLSHQLQSQSPTTQSSEIVITQESAASQTQPSAASEPKTEQQQQQQQRRQPSCTIDSSAAASLPSSSRAAVVASFSLDLGDITETDPFDPDLTLERRLAQLVAVDGAIVHAFQANNRIMSVEAHAQLQHDISFLPSVSVLMCGVEVGSASAAAPSTAAPATAASAPPPAPAVADSCSNSSSSNSSREGVVAFDSVPMKRMRTDASLSNEQCGDSRVSNAHEPPRVSCTVESSNAVEPPPVTTTQSSITSSGDDDGLLLQRLMTADLIFSRPERNDKDDDDAMGMLTQPIDGDVDEGASVHGPITTTTTMAFSDTDIGDEGASFQGPLFIARNDADLHLLRLSTRETTTTTLHSDEGHSNPYFIGEAATAQAARASPSRSSAHDDSDASSIASSVSSESSTAAHGGRASDDVRDAHRSQDHWLSVHRPHKHTDDATSFREHDIIRGRDGGGSVSQSTVAQQQRIAAAAADNDVRNSSQLSDTQHRWAQRSAVKARNDWDDIAEVSQPLLQAVYHHESDNDAINTSSALEFVAEATDTAALTATSHAPEQLVLLPTAAQPRPSSYQLTHHWRGSGNDAVKHTSSALPLPHSGGSDFNGTPTSFVDRRSIPVVAAAADLAQGEHSISMSCTNSMLSSPMFSSETAAADAASMPSDTSQPPVFGHPVRTSSSRLQMQSRDDVLFTHDSSSLQAATTAAAAAAAAEPHSHSAPSLSLVKSTVKHVLPQRPLPPGSSTATIQPLRLVNSAGRQVVLMRSPNITPSRRVVRQSSPKSTSASPSQHTRAAPSSSLSPSEHDLTHSRSHSQTSQRSVDNLSARPLHQLSSDAASHARVNNSDMGSPFPPRRRIARHPITGSPGRGGARDRVSGTGGTGTAAEDDSDPIIDSDDEVEQQQQHQQHQRHRRPVSISSSEPDAAPATHCGSSAATPYAASDGFGTPRRPPRTPEEIAEMNAATPLVYAECDTDHNGTVNSEHQHPAPVSAAAGDAAGDDAISLVTTGPRLATLSTAITVTGTVSVAAGVALPLDAGESSPTSRAKLLLYSQNVDNGVSVRIDRRVSSTRLAEQMLMSEHLSSSHPQHQFQLETGSRLQGNRPLQLASPAAVTLHQHQLQMRIPQETPDGTVSSTSAVTTSEKPRVAFALEPDTCTDSSSGTATNRRRGARRSGNVLERDSDDVVDLRSGAAAGLLGGDFSSSMISQGFEGNERLGNSTNTAISVGLEGSGVHSADSKTVTASPAIFLYRLSPPPPSPASVMSTFMSWGLPTVANPGARYSVDTDVPADPVKISGITFVLRGSSVPFLEQFDTGHTVAMAHAGEASAAASMALSGFWSVPKRVFSINLMAQRRLAQALAEQSGSAAAQLGDGGFGHREGVIAEGGDVIEDDDVDFEDVAGVNTSAAAATATATTAVSAAEKHGDDRHVDVVFDAAQQPGFDNNNNQQQRLQQGEGRCGAPIAADTSSYPFTPVLSRIIPLREYAEIARWGRKTSQSAVASDIAATGAAAVSAPSAVGYGAPAVTAAAPPTSYADDDGIEIILSGSSSAACSPAIEASQPNAIHMNRTHTSSSSKILIPHSQSDEGNSVIIISPESSATTPVYDQQQQRQQQQQLRAPLFSPAHAFISEVFNDGYAAFDRTHNRDQSADTNAGSSTMLKRYRMDQPSFSQLTLPQQRACLASSHVFAFHTSRLGPQLHCCRLLMRWSTPFPSPAEVSHWARDNPAPVARAAGRHEQWSVPRRGSYSRLGSSSSLALGAQLEADPNTGAMRRAIHRPAAAAAAVAAAPALSDVTPATSHAVAAAPEGGRLQLKTDVAASHAAPALGALKYTPPLDLPVASRSPLPSIVRLARDAPPLPADTDMFMNVTTTTAAPTATSSNARKRPRAAQGGMGAVDAGSTTISVGLDSHALSPQQQLRQQGNVALTPASSSASPGASASAASTSRSSSAAAPPLDSNNHLTIISLEMMARTRGDLLPDPQHDEILCIAYAIAHDDLNHARHTARRQQSGAQPLQAMEGDSFSSTLVTGILYSDASQRSVRTHSVPSPSLRAGGDTAIAPQQQQSPTLGLQFDGDATDRIQSGMAPGRYSTVTRVPDEQSLLWALAALVRDWDADIIVGYETQKLSLGYCLERADVLKIPLAQALSRCPSSPNDRRNGNDEYGEKHDSGQWLTGRIVLNMWRLLKSELKLGIYTLENVVHSVLHVRIPLFSPATLAKWWTTSTRPQTEAPTTTMRPSSSSSSSSSSGGSTNMNTSEGDGGGVLGGTRWRVAEYCISRCALVLHVIDALDLVGRTSAMARLFGIDFFSVLSRGSQYRVEAVMLRAAKPLGFIAPSPSREAVARQAAMESKPLILDPFSGVYAEPIVVLDFQSLYPSIVIAYNMCFSTTLGKIVRVSPVGTADSHAMPLSIGGSGLIGPKLGFAAYSPPPGAVVDGYEGPGAGTAVRRLKRPFVAPAGAAAALAAAAPVVSFDDGAAELDADGSHVPEDEARTSSSSPSPIGRRPPRPTSTFISPNGTLFVPYTQRRGVLPRMLQEILDTRIMIKRSMGRPDVKADPTLYRAMNARQYALKMIANVTYGYTAAGFSGRMPCAEIADAIVQTGRDTLERAMSLVESHPTWKAKVVYGDTDSMFVLLKGRSPAEAFRIGEQIAAEVTSRNPRPVTLKMEKVYCTSVLVTMKRYAGFMYDSPPKPIPRPSSAATAPARPAAAATTCGSSALLSEGWSAPPVLDCKGLEMVRRDSCGLVTTAMEDVLHLLSSSRLDLSPVKAYLIDTWTRVMAGRVPLSAFVLAKEVRLGTYAGKSSLPPGAVVAMRDTARDARAEPRYGERVRYVVVSSTDGGKRLSDMVVAPTNVLREPSRFRLNANYYIHKQIIPALARILSLMGAKLETWFADMRKPAMRSLVGPAWGALQLERPPPAAAAAAALRAVQLRAAVASSSSSGIGSSGGDGASKHGIVSRDEQQPEVEIIELLSGTPPAAAAAQIALGYGHGHHPPPRAVQSTIDTYYRSSACDVCGAVCKAAICESCTADPQKLCFLLTHRHTAAEAALSAVRDVCRACTRFDAGVEACESLDCPVYFKRVRLREAEAKTAAVLEHAGFS